MEASKKPGPRLLVVLACADVERAKAFYREAFGWSAAVDIPSIYAELLVSPEARVALYDRAYYERNTGEPSAPAPLRGTTSCELYLSVADPRAALDRVVRAGGRLLSPVARRNWGDDAGYAADPEGNVVAVARSAAS